MLKLFRSAVTSALLTWAWRNRSSIMSFVKDRKNPDPADIPKTGYAETVGKDALIDPAVLSS